MHGVYRSTCSLLFLIFAFGGCCLLVFGSYQKWNWQQFFFVGCSVMTTVHWFGGTGSWPPASLLYRALFRGRFYMFPTLCHPYSKVDFTCSQLSSPTGCRSSLSIWQRPCPGYLKCNCDVCDVWICFSGCR